MNLKVRLPKLSFWLARVLPTTLVKFLHATCATCERMSLPAGGLDIKAGGIMAGMHRDKCGAAAVAGVMAALAITRVRICSFTLLRAGVFFSFLMHWPSLQPAGVKFVGRMAMVRNSTVVMVTLLMKSSCLAPGSACVWSTPMLRAAWQWLTCCARQRKRLLVVL